MKICKDRVWAGIEWRVKEQIWGQLRVQLWDQIQDSYWDQGGVLLWSQMYDDTLQKTK